VAEAYIDEIGDVLLEEALHYCGFNKVIRPKNETDFVVL